MLPFANHEFTLTPTALYAPDGTILRCMNKSMLIHLLNKLATTTPLPQEDKLLEDWVDTTLNVPSRKIALVDGMVLLQQMTKRPATTVTVNALSECFNDRLMSLTRVYDEIILGFDTYRDRSLKSATAIKEGKEEHQSSIRSEMTQT